MAVCLYVLSALRYMARDGEQRDGLWGFAGIKARLPLLQLEPELPLDEIGGVFDRPRSSVRSDG